MTTTHRARVETTLAEAAANHAALLERLSPEMRASLPVDAQGLTEAIDFVAEAAGLSSAERRALVRPHGVNPAVMHARSRLVITHAAWFDPACLEGTGLVLERMISNETELPEHLAFARWGFGSMGDRLPLVELRRG